MSNVYPAWPGIQEPSGKTEKTAEAVRKCKETGEKTCHQKSHFCPCISIYTFFIYFTENEIN